jgi:SAM-dependent methyltransferase
MKDEKIRRAVREGYTRIAKQPSPCCPSADSCCKSADRVGGISKKVGYTEEKVQAVPEGANLGLGCGNPVALASLREGEVVLDLGSGAGFDCFLAANQVGKDGKVIGVDMTPEMIERARKNAQQGNYQNVEFRLGELENLPVADHYADAVISNCVINLVPDKKRVFQETFRVLKPGGRLMVSDIVLLRELPDSIKASVAAYVGCVSGAMQKEDYLGAIRAAGFEEVRVVNETSFPVDCLENDPTAKAIVEGLNIPSEEMKGLATSVRSIEVHGIKPMKEA